MSVRENFIIRNQIIKSYFLILPLLLLLNSTNTFAATEKSCIKALNSSVYNKSIGILHFQLSDYLKSNTNVEKVLSEVMAFQQSAGQEEEFIEHTGSKFISKQMYLRDLKTNAYPLLGRVILEALLSVIENRQYIDLDNNNLHRILSTAVIRLNTMEPGDHRIQPHTDSYPASAVIGLPGDYTGGLISVENKGRNQKEALQLKPGETIIFTADNVHEVSQVHSGIRNTLSIFLDF